MVVIVNIVAVSTVVLVIVIAQCEAPRGSCRSFRDQGSEQVCHRAWLKLTIQSNWCENLGVSLCLTFGNLYVCNHLLFSAHVLLAEELPARRGLKRYDVNVHIYAFEIQIEIIGILTQGRCTRQ